MPGILKVTYFGSVDGSTDGNIDLSVELDDGRTFGFVAYTPQNIAHLMASSYADVSEWVCEGTIIVRRIDQLCITAALEKCLLLGIEKWGVEQKL